MLQIDNNLHIYIISLQITDLPVLNFKLVMIGDMAVGKSSILYRLARDRFLEQTEPTLGASCLTYTYKMTDCTIKFELWDTAGQEKYATLAPMYYRSAPCVIVVYDVTNYKSWQRAQVMLDELKQICIKDCVIGLAGNKADMEEQRKVQASDVKMAVKQHNLIWMETSAKTGLGIQELIGQIAAALPKASLIKKKQSEGEGQKLNVAEPKTKSGCC